VVQLIRRVEMLDQLISSLLANCITESSVDICAIVVSFVVTSFSAIFNVLLNHGTLFLAQGACSSDSCPGSFYLPITAAWANIGYMTHGDFVHFVWNTSFGLWAALFYAVGAAGALIAVSINQPPKTYMWFFLGPAIYSFLVGTPTTVQGVAWRIANKNMDMEEVWRDAETGMANTALVRDLGLQTSRRNGPSGTYQVAWPMVFLDGLFSEATNNLVSWIGMQRREGRGGADSNLFNRETEEGPWQLLANLKWGMVENIVGVSARDPDVRDALVTFLTSECGDQFKKGVNSGAYSAAAQSRGANLPKTVFIGTDPTTEGLNDQVASVGGNSYANFVRGLDTEAIPTPRSMIRLFNSPAITGSFREFSQQFSGTQAYDSGRLTDIVCSEYLYMIVQAMRWEAGHSYHQLLRSFPNGFETAEGALKTLFYGWNLRPQEEAALIEGDELVKYTKHLILVHMIRNELMFAPQVTEQGQRFAPSEQARNHTEDYVRQQGSRAKYGELYQWAVMMPHVQGILAYLVLISYPFAAMLMVVPGYWKVFFTWISFFAWTKLWDVGFAIVHTLERSVWAMIGNHSSMARVGRRLIQTAQAAGSDVQVTCGGGGGGGGGATGGGQKLSQLCSVPQVKEAGSFDEEKAWFLFDQAMLLSGSLDLDLSNGYYIYIMAALYFAVPAVSGQLVLGAKSGLGNLATQAIGQNAQEAGGAAKAGTVGDNTNKLATNRAAIDQGARAQSFRKSGLAQQTLDAQNAAMDADIRGAEVGVHQRAFGAHGDAMRDTMEGTQAHQAFLNASTGGLSTVMGLGQKVNTGGNGGPTGQAGSNKSNAGPGIRGTSGSAPANLAAVGSGAGATGGGGGGGQSQQIGDFAALPSGTNTNTTATATESPINPTASRSGMVNRGWGWGKLVGGAGGRAALVYPGWGMSGLVNSQAQDMFAARAHSNASGLNFGMQKSRADLAKGGFQAYSQSLGAEADYEAGSAAYDALAANASHLAAKAGVTGANPGGLAGSKPSAMRELASSGALGSDVKGKAHYGGAGFMSNMDSMFGSNRSNGAGRYLDHYQQFGFNQAFVVGTATGARQIAGVQALFNDIGNYREAMASGGADAARNTAIGKALSENAGSTGLTPEMSLNNFGPGGGSKATDIGAVHEQMKDLENLAGQSGD
jgi:hypothetical protein